MARVQVNFEQDVGKRHRIERVHVFVNVDVSEQFDRVVQPHRLTARQVGFIGPSVPGVFAAMNQGFTSPGSSMKPFPFPSTNQCIASVVRSSTIARVCATLAALLHASTMLQRVAFDRVRASRSFHDPEYSPGFNARPRS